MTQKEALSIRPASQDDLSAIALMEKRAHPQSQWSEQMFREELKASGVFWVLTDDETDSVLHAFLVARAVEKDWQLLNIVVAPESRGLGFAKMLLHRLVNWALRAEATRITLEVRKSNQAAIELYQQLGFSISSIRKDFYTDGEDAYFFELDLSGAQAVPN